MVHGWQTLNKVHTLPKVLASYVRTLRRQYTRRLTNWMLSPHSGQLRHGSETANMARAHSAHLGFVVNHIHMNISTEAIVGLVLRLFRLNVVWERE